MRKSQMCGCWKQQIRGGRVGTPGPYLALLQTRLQSPACCILAKQGPRVLYYYCMYSTLYLCLFQLSRDQECCTSTVLYSLSLSILAKQGPRVANPAVFLLSRDQEWPIRPHSSCSRSHSVSLLYSSQPTVCRQVDCAELLKAEDVRTYVCAIFLRICQNFVLLNAKHEKQALFSSSLFCTI